MTNGTSIERFDAMACPCEILFDTEDVGEAKRLAALAVAEVSRIEKKYSRYLPGNIVHQINNSGGKPVKVDDETARLLEFADRCYRISNGLFDVTSGVLRRAWKFSGGAAAPNRTEIEKLRGLVGWNKVKWKNPVLCLEEGMEIDFGGIGKEYAVDRALQLIRQETNMAVLVNFGGDIAAEGTRRDGRPWRVGIENPDRADEPLETLSLTDGAIATSGDSKKFVVIDGKRYGHILDPRSGWPVSEAPRSVTVAAKTCSEAGFLSTFGMLNGKDADEILENSGVNYWCH